MLSLLQLILDGLAVNRSEVMFAPAIDVQEIHEIFPTLIECLQIRRNVFAGSELPIIGIDLILHPAEIFYGFAFARIESLDHGLALGVAQLAGAFFFATFY